MPPLAQNVNPSSLGYNPTGIPQFDVTKAFQEGIKSGKIGGEPKKKKPPYPTIPSPLGQTPSTEIYKPTGIPEVMTEEQIGKAISGDSQQDALPGEVIKDIPESSFIPTASAAEQTDEEITGSDLTVAEKSLLDKAKQAGATREQAMMLIKQYRKGEIDEQGNYTKQEEAPEEGPKKGFFEKFTESYTKPIGDIAEVIIKKPVDRFLDYVQGRETDPSNLYSSEDLWKLGAGTTNAFLNLMPSMALLHGAAATETGGKILGSLPGQVGTAAYLGGRIGGPRGAILMGGLAGISNLLPTVLQNAPAPISDYFKGLTTEGKENMLSTISNLLFISGGKYEAKRLGKSQQQYIDELNKLPVDVAHQVVDMIKTAPGAKGRPNVSQKTGEVEGLTESGEKVLIPERSMKEKALGLFAKSTAKLEESIGAGKTYLTKLASKAVPVSKSGKSPKYLERLGTLAEEGLKQIWDLVRTGKVKGDISTMAGTADAVVDAMSKYGQEIGNMRSKIVNDTIDTSDIAKIGEDVLAIEKNYVQAGEGANALKNAVADLSGDNSFQTVIGVKNMLKKPMKDMIKDNLGGTEVYQALKKINDALGDAIENYLNNEKGISGKELEVYRNNLKIYSRLAGMAPDLMKASLGEQAKVGMSNGEILALYHRAPSVLKNMARTTAEIGIQEIVRVAVEEIASKEGALRQFFDGLDRMAVERAEGTRPVKIKVTKGQPNQPKTPPTQPPPPPAPGAGQTAPTGPAMPPAGTPQPTAPTIPQGPTGLQIQQPPMPPATATPPTTPSGPTYSLSNLIKKPGVSGVVAGEKFGIEDLIQKPEVKGATEAPKPTKAEQPVPEKPTEPPKYETTEPYYFSRKKGGWTEGGGVKNVPPEYQHKFNQGPNYREVRVVSNPIDSKIIRYNALDNKMKRTTNEISEMQSIEKQLNMGRKEIVSRGEQIKELARKARSKDKVEILDLNLPENAMAKPTPPTKNPTIPPPKTPPKPTGQTELPFDKEVPSKKGKKK